MIKAIGKGSLASILAAGLNVIRVFTWIGFAGLSAALVAMPLIPPFAHWVRRMRGVNIEGDLSVGAGDFVEVLQHFITFGVALFVIERLLEILKTLRFGSPFVKENAIRFRRLGVALLIGEGSKIIIGIMGLFADADVNGGIDFMTLVAIAAVFVLSAVFSEGARMKEEQDLTV